MFFRTIVIFLFLLFLPSAAAAACSSPAGNAGDITYSSIQAVMAYCNGSAWVAMGSNSTTTYGTLTTNDFCIATNGTTIACNVASTGTGNVVLSASPTLTGTVAGANSTWSGQIAVGTSTLSGTANINGTVTATLFSGSGASLTGIGTANLGGITGTPSSTTYLRGDGTWGTAGGGTLASLTDVTLTSPVSTQILEFNGSKWINAPLGSVLSAGVAPSFLVNKNGATQAMTGSVAKVTWSNIVYDTNSNFASNRYTPTIAGKYIITGSTTFAGQAHLVAAIYKNGALAAQNESDATNNLQVQVTAIVDMNGTSDYIELYASNDNNQNLAGTAANTYFTGSLLAPLASGSVAGTGTANYIPKWSSSTNLTNSLLYDNGTGIGIGTASPVATLDVAGTARLAGTSSAFGALITNAAEPATVSATAATGTINFYLNSQSVLYYTSNASANWTVNFAFSSGTTMNTALAVGQSATAVFLVTQGATAFYNSAVQVDGTTTGVTTKWLGGTPTAGNASGIDTYQYTIIKTGSAAYTVLASQTQFK